MREVARARAATRSISFAPTKCHTQMISLSDVKESWNKIKQDIK